MKKFKVICARLTPEEEMMSLLSLRQENAKDFGKALRFLSLAESLHKENLLFEAEKVLRKAAVYAVFLRRRLRKERQKDEKLNDKNTLTILI